MTARASIDVPRERVFAFLIDLANRPAICDHFLTEFRLQRLESAGVGATARFRVERSGLWMETVIDALEAPFRIHESGRAGRVGRIPVFTVWELVEDPAPGTCEVSVTFWAEPSHRLDRLRGGLRAERWYRHRWERSLARLKDVLENERPVDRVRVAGADRIPAVAGR